MAKRKVTSRYISATAAIWETCYEIVADRWFDVVALFRLQAEGK